MLKSFDGNYGSITQLTLKWLAIGFRWNLSINQRTYISVNVYLVNCTKSTTSHYSFLWKHLCDIYYLKEIVIFESWVSLLGTCAKLHQFFHIHDFLFSQMHLSWIMGNLFKSQSSVASNNCKSKMKTAKLNVTKFNSYLNSAGSLWETKFLANALVLQWLSI